MLPDSKDTSANALVLHEFGESRISDGDFQLNHQYYAKIKIFNQKGFDQATVVIPVHKQDSRKEQISGIVATTYNWENGGVQETKFDPRQVFTENKNKYYDLVKFTLPNVRQGSVIEIQYTFRSPFVFNFKPWEFQSDIPKLHSEYHARIPANYIYNITLKGFYKLTENKSELIKDCFNPEGSGIADCSLLKFVIKDLPAFKEEEYMIAKSNYLSGISFELSEIRYFTGTVDKITKEWKDVDQELRTDDKFGVQLRRGKDVFKDAIALILVSGSDSLDKARKIYHYVRGWYRCNGTYGKYSEFGIKKAYDSKTGNVGDINLSLIAALQYAGFNAEAAILSTRENGLPVELHPVLSEFNYVVAKLNVNGQTYLLDATDASLPFGVLPIRCLNGKARIIPAKKSSYWMEILPKEKRKQTTYVDLKLQENGRITGKINVTHSGYDAIDERETIASHSSLEKYVQALGAKWNSLQITQHSLSNVDDADKPLTGQFSVEIEGADYADKSKLYLNPFFTEKLDKNPFTLQERLFPVDFGAPIESQLIVRLEIPEQFVLIDPPAPVALGLPNKGGRFLFDVQQTGKHITLKSLLSLNRAVYSPDEYHYLKELFNKVIEAHQTNLVLSRK